MQLGTQITDQHCNRCYKKLTIPAVYREGMWWHDKCFNDGARQLANATRIATAFEFQSHLPMIHNIEVYYSDLL